MKKLLVVLALIIASPAIAQHQPADVRAAAELGSQIGAMALKIHQQQDQITLLQDQLAKAQARIKELEPKPPEERP